MVEKWVVCVDEIKNCPEIGVKGQKYRVWFWNYGSDYAQIKFYDGNVRPVNRERFRPLSQISIPLDSLI